jgi:hypothetical protein
MNQLVGIIPTQAIEDAVRDVAGMHETYPTVLGRLSGGEFLEQIDVGGTGVSATLHDASAI